MMPFPKVECFLAKNICTCDVWVFSFSFFLFFFQALTIASFWGLHGMPILCGKRLSEIRQGIHKDLLEMLSGILQKLLILVPMDLWGIYYGSNSATFIRPQHQGNWDGRDANLVYGKDDLLNKTSLLKCSQSWCSVFEQGVLYISLWPSLLAILFSYPVRSTDVWLTHIWNMCFWLLYLQLTTVRSTCSVCLFNVTCPSTCIYPEQIPLSQLSDLSSAFPSNTPPFTSLSVL